MYLDFDKIFGNDSGEDEERSVLAGYFVDIPIFNKFYSRENNLSIVRARKGMGKSALLKMMGIKIDEGDDSNSENFVISVTGNELIGMGDFDSLDNAYLENHWKLVICKRLCLEIGRRINFAGDDDSISLVEASEIEGFKGKNIFSLLLGRFGDVLAKGIEGVTGVGDVNFHKALSQDGNINNPFQFLRRYQEKPNKTIWLLIDDIDAKYIDDEKNQHKIGAFFSAIRSLAFSVEGLKIRASVRSDVWRNLRRMEDQDKIRQYVVDILWSEKDLKSIFLKKILSYLQRNKYAGSKGWSIERNEGQIISSVFQGKFEWGGLMDNPFVPIKFLAGNRPRWMGQLCKLAGAKSNGLRIKNDNIFDAMREFGQEKVSDILKEHIHQFYDLSKVLDVFRGGKREYNRYALCKIIKEKYVERMNSIPDVNGYPFKDPDQIGELLYQIDFLTAKRKGKKDFITYQDDPELFSSGDNSSNLIQWTVNSSYRNYLQIN